MILQKLNLLNIYLEYIMTKDSITIGIIKLKLKIYISM